MTGPESGTIRVRAVIDRWEGDTAVVELEDGAVFDLPRWMLPPGTGEGEWVAFESRTDEEGGRHLRVVADPEATRAARGAAEAILARLRGRDPGGDLSL